jgi:hypothetical protein
MLRGPVVPRLRLDSGHHIHHPHPVNGDGRLVDALLAGQEPPQNRARLHRGVERSACQRRNSQPQELIAAHAQLQCDRLAAIDRGYLRRYFPRLRLLSPE